MDGGTQMDLVPANKDQLEKIFEDIKLKEDEHVRDTAALKLWLHSQPHLPHDIDDTMLASFIVGCKNSLERAKLMLDTYLTNRTSCPDFYQFRDPCDPEFQRLTKLVQYYVLPKMTPEGYRVSFISMKSPDVSAAEFNLRLNAIKVLSSFDVRLLEEKYWAGDILVMDCKHFGMKHLQSVVILPILRKYIHCANQSLPVRYKKTIFMNMPPAANPVLSMVKMILKKKFVQRMVTTSEDYTCLYEYIPQEILPNEYGGKAGTIEDLNDSWQLKVESYRDWFLKDMARKVDESKRPERTLFKEKQLPVYGLEGSFRTLTID